MVKAKFWKDRSVLVTGGSGFVGAHLVKELISLQAKVCVIGIESKFFSPTLSITELRNVSYFQGDVTQATDISQIFSKYQFQTVFHLAAQPLVEQGESNPAQVFEVNVMGTIRILEGVRNHDNCSLVLASTAHVYGENQVPLLEEYFPRPSRPYETSKACADMVAQSYANYFHLPIAIARFVNTYGPGDMQERLIPHTIKLLMQNNPPILFNQLVTRDFLFIDDAVLAYLVLAEAVANHINHDFNIIYNFGTGKHYSMLDVITIVAQLMGKSHILPEIQDSIRKTDIKNQYLSVIKAYKTLGWQAQTSLESGLEKTIAWYQKQLED